MQSLLRYEGTVSASYVCIENYHVTTISQFRCETENSSYVEWPSALLDASEINEFLLDDIDFIIAGHLDDDKLKRLDEFFRSSDLYCKSMDENGADAAVVILSPDGCHILK